jgi:hypothetical protein
VRETRMLRAMRRALETGLRQLLTGHDGGNAGYRQGVSYGLPRQCSTLPGLGAAGIRPYNCTTSFVLRARAAAMALRAWKDLAQQ